MKQLFLALFVFLATQADAKLTVTRLTCNYQGDRPVTETTDISQTAITGR